MSEKPSLFEELFGKKTPHETQKEAPKPEPEKIEPPAEPTPKEPPTFKTFPTGSPQAKTKGMTKIAEKVST